jgi:uncharacterized protein
MALTREEMDRKLDEHFAFEAADDVEGVLSTLRPDVTHDIVGWPGGVSRSPQEARVFYEQLFADLDEGKVTSVKRLYGENFMVDESVWEGRAVGRPFGIEGRGRPLKFRLLHIVEFDDDGRLKLENVWIDLAAIIQQLPEA